MPGNKDNLYRTGFTKVQWSHGLEGDREGKNLLHTVRKSRTEISRLGEKEGQGMSSSYLWGDCLVCIPSMSPTGPIRKFEGCDPGCSWFQSVLMRGLIHPGDSMTSTLHILLASMRQTKTKVSCQVSPIPITPLTLAQQDGFLTCVTVQCVYHREQKHNLKNMPWPKLNLIFQTTVIYFHDYCT